MARAKCPHSRRLKSTPYGGATGKSWCPQCDRYYGPNYAWDVSPRRARQKSKKELRVELDETNQKDPE